MPLKEKLENIVEKTLKSLGFVLVRLNFRRGYLQVMAERPSYQSVTIDDCELISRNLSTILDVENIIDGEYDLEVTSTGVERPLIKLQDFIYFRNVPISIILKNPLSLPKNEKDVELDLKRLKVLVLDIETKEKSETESVNNSEDAIIHLMLLKNSFEKNRFAKKTNKKLAKQHKTSRNNSICETGANNGRFEEYGKCSIYFSNIEKANLIY